MEQSSSSDAIGLPRSREKNAVLSTKKRLAVLEARQDQLGHVMEEIGKLLVTMNGTTLQLSADGTRLQVLSSDQASDVFASGSDKDGDHKNKIDDKKEKLQNSKTSQKSNKRRSKNSLKSWLHTGAGCMGITRSALESMGFVRVADVTKGRTCWQGQLKQVEHTFVLDAQGRAEVSFTGTMTDVDVVPRCVVCTSNKSATPCDNPAVFLMKSRNTEAAQSEDSTDAEKDWFMACKVHASLCMKRMNSASSLSDVEQCSLVDFDGGDNDEQDALTMLVNKANVSGRKKTIASKRVMFRGGLSFLVDDGVVCITGDGKLIVQTDKHERGHNQHKSADKHQTGVGSNTPENQNGSVVTTDVRENTKRRREGGGLSTRSEKRQKVLESTDEATLAAEGDFVQQHESGHNKSSHDQETGSTNNTRMARLSHDFRTLSKTSRGIDMELTMAMASWNLGLYDALGKAEVEPRDGGKTSEAWASVLSQTKVWCTASSDCSTVSLADWKRTGTVLMKWYLQVSRQNFLNTSGRSTQPGMVDSEQDNRIRKCVLAVNRAARAVAHAPLANDHVLALQAMHIAHKFAYPPTIAGASVANIGRAVLGSTTRDKGVDTESVMPGLVTWLPSNTATMLFTNNMLELWLYWHATRALAGLLDPDKNGTAEVPRWKKQLARAVSALNEATDWEKGSEKTGDMYLVAGATGSGIPPWMNTERLDNKHHDESSPFFDHTLYAMSVAAMAKKVLADTVQ